MTHDLHVMVIFNANACAHYVMRENKDAEDGLVDLADHTLCIYNTPVFFINLTFTSHIIFLNSFCEKSKFWKLCYWTKPRLLLKGIKNFAALFV